MNLRISVVVLFFEPGLRPPVFGYPSEMMYDFHPLEESVLPVFYFLTLVLTVMRNGQEWVAKGK